MSAQIKTLSCIDHVIRMYYSPERFETCAPALKWLLDEGLIEEDGSWWRTTERARVYVEAIRDLPLPERFTEWRIPT